MAVRGYVCLYLSLVCQTVSDCQSVVELLAGSECLDARRGRADRLVRLAEGEADVVGAEALVGGREEGRGGDRDDARFFGKPAARAETEAR